METAVVLEGTTFVHGCGGESATFERNIAVNNDWFVWGQTCERNFAEYNDWLVWGQTCESEDAT